MPLFLIGEKLNSSIPSARELMLSGDAEQIKAVMRRQVDFGADALDINTAATGNERAVMMRLCALALENTDAAVMVDSTDPKVICEAAEFLHSHGRRVMINSVTAGARLRECAETAAKTGADVVLMPIGSRMPETVGEAAVNAVAAAGILGSYGVSPDNIYIDILVQALASNDQAGRFSLELTAEMKRNNMKTVAGVSNIGFGLPSRSLINRAFITAAIAAGLDAAIADVTALWLGETVAAASLVAGIDEDCMDYITFIRDRED